MDFIRVIETVAARLDEAGVRYALIGGFAMALRGVQRATVDLDFILMREDLEKADVIITDCGYRRAFRNENASHYLADDGALGRIDLLHAFRSPSLSMLDRADQIEVVPGLRLPVVQHEDLIGLKVQALVNDPGRATADWSDIRMIVESCATGGREMDWDLVEEYLGIFNLTGKLVQLRTWYGAIDRI